MLSSLPSILVPTVHFQWASTTCVKGEVLTVSSISRHALALSAIDPANILLQAGVGDAASAVGNGAVGVLPGKDVAAENGVVGLEDGGVDADGKGGREEEGGEGGELHFGCFWMS